MRERPILFSSPMVRAILNGRKTQTRRVVTPQPRVYAGGCHQNHKPKHSAPYFDAYCNAKKTEVNPRGMSDRWCWCAVDDRQGPDWIRCPYGVPGDRLWVRETWVELLAVSPATDEPMPIGPGERLIEPPTQWTDSEGRLRWHYDGRVIAYRANSNVEFCDGDGFSGDMADRDDIPRWRPSIHMPRWASRITLEITDIHVERLLDISEEDAWNEGIAELTPSTVKSGVCNPVVAASAVLGLCRSLSPSRRGFLASCASAAFAGITGWLTPSTIPQSFPKEMSGRQAFALLWDSINAKRGCGWEINPWVWVISFKPVKGGE